MSNPDFLAARDINSRAETHTSFSIPVSTGNPVLDANLYDISRRFCGEHSPDTVLQMLSTVMNVAASPLGEHSLEIMNRSMAEMFDADKMFYPYRNRRKIACFGSARIQPSDPSYIQARAFADLASSQGYMVITGGGPGLMQACNEGATEESSFGLNITLPFEQHPNPIMQGSDKMMNFYYFFTRKLNFLKESDALVAFPGGFGTMDEIFEAITLIQTGKCTIFPVILMDPPGESFWHRWVHFIEKELLQAGLISPEDMKLLYISKDAEDAYHHIAHFYSRYHSYYFDGDRLSIRLSHPMAESSLPWLREDFKDIMPLKDLEQLMEDHSDPEENLGYLCRLKFTFKRGNYARLRELIDAINDLD